MSELTDEQKKKEKVRNKGHKITDHRLLRMYACCAINILSSPRRFAVFSLKFAVSHHINHFQHRRHINYRGISVYHQMAEEDGEFDDLDEDGQDDGDDSVLVGEQGSVISGLTRSSGVSGSISLRSVPSTKLSSDVWVHCPKGKSGKRGRERRKEGFKLISRFPIVQRGFVWMGR